MKQSLAHELTERGFVYQFSGDSLEKVFGDDGQRTVFLGIDPSADSAHAGNMATWMMLRHIAAAGHKIIFLVGGGTGMIGDPKPDAERELKDASIVEESTKKLEAQAQSFFEGCDIEFVNNLDWLGELKLIDFLRDIGKHYTVNELIKKDAIATRLESEAGLSYTEFAYPLLQGYDFYKLYQEKGCTVQVGGSDQWGNLISGVDLIRRKVQGEAFAITIPLIVDKTTGKKFGKSEGNAVWLDPEKTSPYEFYQFWLNTSDESVIEYLKIFTLLTLEEIIGVAQQHQQDPAQRIAQKMLAENVTRFVHGDGAAQSAMRVTEVLFGSASFSTLTQQELIMLREQLSCGSEKGEISLTDALVLVGLTSSKREARTLIEAGAVEVNKTRAVDSDLVLTKETVGGNGGNVLLKKGKQHALVEIT